MNAGLAQRRRDVPAALAAAGAQATGTGARVWWAYAFLGSLMVPNVFFIGTLMLQPYRIVLLLAFVPVLIGFLSGRTGRMQWVDFLVMAYALWVVVSLVAYAGLGEFQGAAIGLVETVSAYLLARYAVRTIDDMDRVLRFMFLMLLFLLPGVIAESFFGYRLYPNFFSNFGTVFVWDDPKPRLGFYRAQTVFEHPILFGIVTGSTFALLFLRVNPASGRIFGLKRGWAALAAAFFSLSSGAFFAVGIQIAMMCWDFVLRTMRGRWYLLIGLGVTWYVVVDLLSNRTPFLVISSYLSFNASTGYMRMYILEYGLQNLWDNPIFGIGRAPWDRPWWMRSASIDNFWLYTAMRHGLPAFVFMLGTFLAAVAGMALQPIRSRRAANMRLGLICGLTGIAFAIYTVHMWAGAFSYMMFYIGLSGWIINNAATLPADDAAPEDPPDGGPDQAPVSRYTRFAPGAAPPDGQAQRGPANLFSR